MPVSVCFVCLGNICRSPTAEGVMRHLVREEGLEGHVVADSAGTGSWHVGEAPDARARRAGARRGIAIEGRARQFRAGDFSRFEYVLAMDRANYDVLRELARGAEQRKRIHLLRSFDPSSPRDASVPDPYYGGDDGFDEVLDLCLSACRGLLAAIRREHGL